MYKCTEKISLFLRQMHLNWLRLVVFLKKKILVISSQCVNKNS